MELVKAYVARDSLEAHFLKNVLAEHGIEAAVMGESLTTARGELPPTLDTLPSVWVFDQDAPQTAMIVEDFVARRLAEPAEPAERLDNWICPACGEAIEGQFTDCWNCQAPRPD